MAYQKLTWKAREVLTLCCVATLALLWSFNTPTNDVFVGVTTPRAAVVHSTTALQAQKPVNDPGSLGPYQVNAKDAASFKPTVGSADNSSSGPFWPSLLAGLPSMLLPGLGILLLIGLLRLLRNPILRLLGVDPATVDNNPINKGYYSSSPYGQNNPFQQPPYGQGGYQSGTDIEASIQKLLENATPEEAEQLKAVAERMKNRSPEGPTPSPSSSRPGAWVTPEPIPANPAEALTPEQRRERAREKARSQAMAQAPADLKNDTQTWAQRQTQNEKSMAAQGAADYNALEDDAKVVAVASVVLTAFVVAEADARGYKTQP